MFNLVAAAAFFLLIHVLISGSRVRGLLIARLGEPAYRGLFSVLSVAGLAWLVMAYARAPFQFLWVPPEWLRLLALPLVFVAFLIGVPGILTPNPTAAAFEARLQRADAVQGIIRVTRHPFLWGATLWAAAHVLANGDLGALVLFGSLLLLTVHGTFSIDRKRRGAYGESWRAFAAATSNVPFAAILAGRNHFALREIGLWRLAAALTAFLAVLFLHPVLFGTRALL
jgi:uncharacterized membrane protein